MRVFGRRLAQDKGWTAGTHRTRSPAETVADYARFMPVMGITRLANVTGLDDIGMPVYIAIRPNSRGLSTSQGKGDTRDAAKASALMESIENWHGERIERPLRYQSYAEIARAVDAVDPRDVPRRAGGVLRLDAPILWLEGWDLLRERPSWVPYDSVHTNFVTPACGLGAFLSSTSGLASGNHTLEALCHALCEVIERDAATLHRLCSDREREHRHVDLDTVGDAACRRVLDQLRAADMVVAAWDITTDVGVPTYTCQIVEGLERPRWRAVGLAEGHGCHLSPPVALLRALTEAVQSRLTYISGSRDDVLPRDYVACSNDDDWRRTVDQLTAPRSRRSFADRTSAAADRFEDDLATLLGSLRGAGIDSAVAVDLAKPVIGIPVVKLVVPGLESVHTPVYVPGRRARARMAEEAA